MRKQMTGRRMSIIAALFMTMSSVVAANPVVEKPTAGNMVLDITVARPILLATTLGGAAAYLVSLPFSLPGGNADEVAELLVKAPARATFVRCLGCVTPGKKAADTVRQ